MKKTFLMIFLLLSALAVWQLVPGHFEYKKDQAYLVQNFKVELPENPLLEITQPVKSYLITTGGFCWLMNGAGIANYLEPDIDFDNFVLYGTPTLFMAGRTEAERYGPGLNHIRAFKNLGYAVYLGSTSLQQPPHNVIPDIESENLIYFKNKDQEFLFIKKLLNVGVVPMVFVGGDFLGLAGYNEEGVWLTGPEVAHEKRPKNMLETVIVDELQFMSYDQFYNKWGNYNQFFWFDKTSDRKTITEVYEINKKHALEAPENIKATTGILKNLIAEQSISHIYTHDFDTPSVVALHRYFENENNQELAQKYLEIAAIYDEARESLGPNPPRTASAEFLIQLLAEALPFYEEAASMWP